MLGRLQHIDKRHEQKLQLAGQVETLLKKNVIQGVPQGNNTFSKAYDRWDMHPCFTDQLVICRVKNHRGYRAGR